MAIAYISSGEKYQRAKAIVKAEGGDFLEVFKKIGGKHFEGTNKEVEPKRKIEAVYDEIKPKRKKKVVKKVAKKKKK